MIDRIDTLRKCLVGIRILHVLDKINVDSGVSSMVMNYYSKLNHDEITFDFMVNDEIDAKIKAYIEGSGSKIYVMPKLKITNMFKYILALKKFYKNHNYNIIHGHVANSAFIYLGLAKNIPYKIIQSHSIKSSDIMWKRVRNWFLTRFIKYVSNYYIACSKEAANFLFGTIDNVTILNNAIDVNRFAFNGEVRTQIRSSLGLKNEIIIGHIGRFNPVKNHSFLIDVFNEVFKVNKNIRLLLIGGGDLHKCIIQKVKHLSLVDAVLFIEPCENIEDYMSVMDVLVLPSLFEGFGMVGIEAQASGLRVLASEHVPSLIDITGNVDFLKLDKEIWVKRLIDLHASTNRQEQGNKVKNSKFDIKTQVSYLCKYYEKLLNNTRQYL